MIILNTAQKSSSYLRTGENPWKSSLFFSTVYWFKKKMFFYFLLVKKDVFLPWITQSPSKLILEVQDFRGALPRPLTRCFPAKSMGNLQFLDFLERGYTESTNLGISWDCRCCQPRWWVTARLDLDLLIDQWKLLLPGLTMQVSGRSGSFKTTWFRLLDWLHDYTLQRSLKNHRFTSKRCDFFLIIPIFYHFSLKKTTPSPQPQAPHCVGSAASPRCSVRRSRPRTPCAGSGAPSPLLGWWPRRGFFGLSAVWKNFGISSDVHIMRYFLWGKSMSNMFYDEIFYGVNPYLNWVSPNMSKFKLTELPKKIDVCVFKFCTYPGMNCEKRPPMRQKIGASGSLFFDRSSLASNQSRGEIWLKWMFSCTLKSGIVGGSPPITGVQGNLWQSWKFLLVYFTFCWMNLPLFCWYMLHLMDLPVFLNVV